MSDDCVLCRDMTEFNGAATLCSEHAGPTEWGALHARLDAAERRAEAAERDTAQMVVVLEAKDRAWLQAVEQATRRADALAGLLSETFDLLVDHFSDASPCEYRGKDKYRCVAHGTPGLYARGVCPQEQIAALIPRAQAVLAATASSEGGEGGSDDR